MLQLPESEKDKSKILELFVLKMKETNKKEGRVFGSYQILEIIEEISIKEGMIKCPVCGRK